MQCGSGVKRGDILLWVIDLRLKRADKSNVDPADRMGFSTKPQTMVGSMPSFAGRCDTHAVREFG